MLVTNDRRLTLALEMLQARCPHIVRGLVIPTRKVGAGGDLEHEANVSLAKLAHWVRRHIAKDELRGAQLPDVVPGRRRGQRQAAFMVCETASPRENAGDGTPGAEH